MFLTNGKDYFSVQDLVQIEKLKAAGYKEITAADLVSIKLKAMVSYVQQSGAENTKPISG